MKETKTAFSAHMHVFSTHGASILLGTVHTRTDNRKQLRINMLGAVIKNEFFATQFDT